MLDRLSYLKQLDYIFLQINYPLTAAFFSLLNRESNKKVMVLEVKPKEIDSTIDPTKYSSKNPEKASYPFLLKPLVAMVPGTAMDHTTLSMTNNAASSNPGGSVKR